MSCTRALGVSALFLLSLPLSACVGGAAEEPAQGRAQEALRRDDDDDRDGGRRCRRPQVPAELAVPRNECLKVSVLGTGVQIYTCSTLPAGGFGYVLKAPEANLIDDEGDYKGNHFLGPKWQWRDGSKVGAARVAQVDAPDPSAVPWLLLQVNSQDGAGKLADTVHIQRINTRGGRAPTTGCDATTVGTDVRIGYTADYLFYHVR